MVTGYALVTLSIVDCVTTSDDGTGYAKLVYFPEVDVVDDGTCIDRLN